MSVQPWRPRARYLIPTVMQHISNPMQDLAMASLPAPPRRRRSRSFSDLPPRFVPGSLSPSQHQETLSTILSPSRATLAATLASSGHKSSNISKFLVTYSEVEVGSSPPPQVRRTTINRPQLLPGGMTEPPPENVGMVTSVRLDTCPQGAVYSSSSSKPPVLVMGRTNQTRTVRTEPAQ